MSEAAIAGAMASAFAALLGSGNAWLPDSPLHPASLLVLFLGAFYGLRGLIIAAPTIWFTVATSALVMGAGFTGAGRITSLIDLSLAASALTLAAFGMVHTRSRRALEEEVVRLREQHSEDTQLLDGLQDRVLQLIARNERIDLSVRFWRDVAGRLESLAPEQAASAALEMCLVRTGARAGIVKRVENTGMRNLAWRGQWSKEREVPRDIFADATIAAAAEHERLVLASEVEGSCKDHSDVALPITHARSGRILGVLALRGLKRSRLGAAELQDLRSTAEWLTVSLTAEEDRLEPQASGSVEPDRLPPAPAAPRLQLVKVDL